MTNDGPGHTLTDWSQLARQCSNIMLLFFPGVHLVMNDLLPPGSYYRFNPPLMAECAMDEIDSDKLDNLVVDAQAYIRYVTPHSHTTLF